MAKHCEPWTSQGPKAGNFYDVLPREEYLGFKEENEDQVSRWHLSAINGTETLISASILKMNP
jgi:hypothetical protein